MFRSSWYRNVLISDMKAMRQLTEITTTRTIKNVMSVKTENRETPIHNDIPGDQGPPCEIRNSYRQCEDGSCIPEVDLCPDEQLMNQNTILIMIVVGLAVVIFLIVLYCFQQRQRTPGNRNGQTGGINGNYDDEQDRLSLFVPPPPYDEALNTDMYPPTPQMQQRRNRINSFDEPPPMTPPPNYDMALSILARSHESILTAKPNVPRRQSSGNLVRRSVSMDGLNNQGRDNNTVIQLGEICEVDNQKTNLNRKTDEPTVKVIS